MAFRVPKLSYVSRFEYLVDLCRGKTVLHLGCVGPLRSPDACLHVALSKVCKRLVGVDIDGDGLTILRAWLPGEREFPLLKANVFSLTLDETFDVVLVADLIEHVSNPGLLLEVASRFMHAEDSLLVITTPSQYGLPNYLRFALRRAEIVHPDHKVVFSFSTLAALAREYGLRPVEWRTAYDFPIRNSNWVDAIKNQAGVALLKLMPQFGGTLICVLQKRVNGTEKQD